MTVTDIDLDVFEQIVTEEDVAPPCEGVCEPKAGAEWWIKFRTHECGPEGVQIVLSCTPCKDLALEETTASNCGACNARILPVKDYILELGEL